MSTATPTASTSRSGWLFGPVPDLLFGCGLAWMLVFALRGVAGGAVAQAVPGAMLIMLFALPHYGATLVLVYESAESRRKYTLFSVYASLLLAILLAVSVRNVLVGSLILTIYLSWSPWHYTGQNYGIFLTLLGRQGVRPSAKLKRLVYFSFVASFLLTFLSIHGGDRASYAPVSYAGSVFRLMPIGIPGAINDLLLPLVALVYIGCTATAVVQLLRLARPSALVGCFTLFLTQALWFSIPVIIRVTKLLAGDATTLELYSAYGFIWIAAAHSVQYLWFCTYYATGSHAPRKALGYLGKSYLGGYAIWTLPAVIFAPALLGRFPADAGLTLMVASVVNLHHFVIDGAIWKLRDSKVARVLLRDERAASGTRETTPGDRRRPFLVVVSIAGALAFGCVILNHIELEYGFRQALERNDLTRAQVALQRLSWIGNDSPDRRTQLGRRYAREGDLASAVLEFQRSLDLHPTAGAWRSMAQIYEENERWEQAREAYRKALAIDRRHVPSLIGSGVLWLRLGRPDLALPRLERAASISPYDEELQAPLKRARAAMESRGG